MTPAAIFLPIDPDATVFDLTEQIRAGLQKGLRLYTNGRQMALLPKPARGWSLFIIRTPEANPPCAA